MFVCVCVCVRARARARASACVCACARVRVCVCVCVALVIQHAKHKRHVILSSVACPTPQHLYTLSNKGHDFFRKNVIENKTKCVFLFPLQICLKHFSFY